MPTLLDLLSRGYLPKELPDPFSSASYGRAMNKAAASSFLSGPPQRFPSNHNLARPGFTTRRLSIPDPVHFLRLSRLMANSWPDLLAACQSRLSLTTPVEDKLHVRALVPAGSGSERYAKRAEHRARSRYLIRVDVSQFYPSVYTHSLDWAIRTKAIARASRGGTGLGPELDRHVRDGQGGQTLGIPIGSDTSLVLGELLLGQVDRVLARRRKVHGFRYYDDYELHASTRRDAEEAVADVQVLLADWELTVNPYKVEILELPLPVEEEWVSSLKRIRIGTRQSSERSDLYTLFDEAFRLARRFPGEQVLAYALGRFISGRTNERHRVSKANWAQFLRLLLQAVLSEPGLLPRALYMMNWGKLRGMSLDLSTIGEALELLIIENGARGNASEVAWAIWSATALGISLGAKAVRAISRMTDDVVAITALHARSKGLLPGLDTSSWESLMTEASLTEGHWLLAYEALVRRWLPSATGSDYIAADAPFAYLRANRVRFYDPRVALPRLPSRKKPAAPAPSVAEAREFVVTPDLVRYLRAADRGVLTEEARVEQVLDIY